MPRPCASECRRLVDRLHPIAPSLAIWPCFEICRAGFLHWCIAPPNETELAIPNSVHEQEVIHFQLLRGPRKITAFNGSTQVGTWINRMLTPSDWLNPTLVRIQFVKKRLQKGIIHAGL